MKQPGMAIGRWVLVLAAAATLVAATTGTASATPAHSATSVSTTQRPGGGPSPFLATGCRVVWPVTSCKTGTIHAGPFHSIFYRMCAASDHYADWQVKDADNGVIVRQGRVQAGFCNGAYIYGLYGNYWAWVFNTRAGATAYIDNG